MSSKQIVLLITEIYLIHLHQVWSQLRSCGSDLESGANVDRSCSEKDGLFLGLSAKCLQRALEFLELRDVKNSNKHLVENL